MRLALRYRESLIWIRSGKRSFSILSGLRAPEPVRSDFNEKSNPKGELTAKGESSTPMQGSTESISKAMKSYLERAEAHHKFMKDQEEEFVFGRRHLANMMGKDPETFTQRDVEEAIRYLFPAAVSVASAKPMMKPPNEIHPRAKSAQFDASGRPLHPFFYTTKANFYNIVYEAVAKLNALDSMASSHADPPPSDATFAGTVWIPKLELEELTLEALTDDMYNQWVVCMDRLAEHPRHAREKEWISSFRKPLSSQVLQNSFPPILLDSDGRQTAHVPFSLKKTAVGSVKVTMPGSGKIDINGQGLDYFPLMRAREAFIYPLQQVNWLGTVDIVAKVEGSGVMAQAAVLRWGVATAIAALGADVEALRLAGLLTKDRRKKEKRHQGCEGARAAWTWKKR